MQTLLRTPLYERHVALGARLVPFAGWEMPVQYEGVIPEHRAVRADAGVFDVSHMGEIEVEGPRARELLQAAALERPRSHRAGPGAIHAAHQRAGRHRRRPDRLRARPAALPPDRQRVPTASPISAGCTSASASADVRDVSDDYALLAVQGPRALERLGLPAAPAFTFADGEIDGVGCMVNRTGYTGEEGVELLASRRSRRAVGCASWRGASRPAGSALATPFGSRSATRCTETTSGPTRTRSPRGSAGSARSRRSSPAPASCGASRRDGPEQKLAAFVMEEPGIPRQGMAITERRRGHLRLPLADAGAGDRPGLRPGRERAAGHRAHDRRSRPAAPRACRQEAHLLTGGTLNGRCRELPGRPPLPPRA